MTKAHANKLTWIVRNERQRLLGFIRTKISSLEESEDLLQDVFLQLAGNLNVLESIDNLSGWLYTVTNNRIIDWYRRKKPQTVSINESDENGINLEKLIAEELPDPGDDEMRELVNEAIIECIDQLPEKQRYVFVEQVINGRTFRELADETGESQNTLLARKRYAVRSLREQLSEIRKLYQET